MRRRQEEEEAAGESLQTGTRDPTEHGSAHLTHTHTHTHTHTTSIAYLCSNPN